MLTRVLLVPKLWCCWGVGSGDDSLGELEPKSEPESRSDRVEHELVREPESDMKAPPSDTESYSSKVAEQGDEGGVGRSCGGGAEKEEHAMIRRFSSLTVILSSGSRSKIIPRMSFSSSERGRMVFRKLRFRVKALYVVSSVDACFHGLRPHVRLTRITPRDQMSLGAHRYDAFLGDWSRHSGEKREMLERERGKGGRVKVPTWAHVEGGSAAMVLGFWICRGETKVCKQDLASRPGHQNVLWLEISMVYSKTMAVFHGIENLHESLTDKSVVADVPTPFGNI